VDLSYRRFEADGDAIQFSPDLALLLVGVITRQATSATARLQAMSVGRTPLAGPLGLERGAFHVTTALWLARLAEP